MSTAQFHRMKLDPTQRTPIQIVPSALHSRCLSCHRLVVPHIILTAFLSAPLSVCPHCRSVIQQRVSA